MSLSEKIRSSVQPDETSHKKIPKNIDYYLRQEGEAVDENDKYEMFNEWCRKEGVIMPKLEYPAVFENGLIGVRCTADI